MDTKKKKSESMSAAKYKEILKDNMIQSARELWLGRRFIFQQDNEPNHKEKATQKWFKNDKVNVLERQSRSPDFNPLENLWLDLKRAVYARSPCNLTEPEQFCREDWGKIAVSVCARLIETNPHRLVLWLRPKVCLLNTDLKGANT